MQNRDKVVNKAKVDAQEIITKAMVESHSMRNQAETAKLSKIKSAEADRLVFLARQKVRELAPRLVDFRLIWNTWIAGLKGQPKVLIDSDKAAGKQRLFLGDPDQFRIPAQLLPPPREKRDN